MNQSSKGLVSDVYERGQEEVPETFTDTPKLRKAVKTAFKRFDEIEAQREILNADRAEVLNNLKAQGLSKKAVLAAYARHSQDPEKRRKFDDALTYICDVMDCGFDQTEMELPPADEPKH